MKLLWLDLNSSYAHSSLALPALHAQIADDTTIECFHQDNRDLLLISTLLLSDSTLLAIKGILLRLLRGTLRLQICSYIRKQRYLLKTRGRRV